MPTFPNEIWLMVLRLSSSQTAARCVLVSKAMREIALISLFQCVDLNRDPIHTVTFCTYVLSPGGVDKLPLLRHLTIHEKTFSFPHLGPPIRRFREEDPAETQAFQLFSQVICRLASLKTLLTIHLDNAPLTVARMFDKDTFLACVQTATFFMYLPSLSRFTNITSLALKHLGTSAANNIKKSAIFPSLASLSAPLHVFDAFSYQHPLVHVTIRDSFHHRARPDWISSLTRINTLSYALERGQVESLVIGIALAEESEMEHCFDRLSGTASSLQSLSITLHTPVSGSTSSTVRHDYYF